ncbi:MAG: NAD-dependent epimerase/dehydratase [Anaerolineales bacterium]|nr:NAD-dependent epimerase/dehydratase [Anaerolineales bacterium]
MSEPGVHVVTGAFGYTGRYVTHRLLAKGIRVKTLTGHPDRPNPFGEQVSAVPFNFDKPGELVKSLRGAAVLYNTYWVRFTHGSTGFDQAVENTKTLVRAAEEAGVSRIVHVSIANADSRSPLPYYRGKGLLEEFIQQSKLSHAIVCPTVIYSTEDILINNIAWIVRRFPAFGVPGKGGYGLQPIFVDDMADLMVDAGSRTDNMHVDAVGPEIFTFDELVRLIARKINRRVMIIHMPPGLALFASQFIGLMVGDVVLTREEVDGLMANLLVSKRPPTGTTKLSEWLSQNADKVGAQYASELGRHFR